MPLQVLPPDLEVGAPASARCGPIQRFKRGGHQMADLLHSEASLNFEAVTLCASYFTLLTLPYFTLVTFALLTLLLLLYKNFEIWITTTARNSRQVRYVYVNMYVFLYRCIYVSFIYIHIHMPTALTYKRKESAETNVCNEPAETTARVTTRSANYDALHTYMSHVTHI